MRSDLTPFLRCVVFVGEPAFRLRFEIERVGLKPIGRLDQIIMRAARFAMS